MPQSDGRGFYQRPCEKARRGGSLFSRFFRYKPEEIWNGIGNPVYPPAKAELEKHGLSCDGKRAVQLQKNDYDKYDLFIGMDSANIRNMLRIFGGDPAGKVHKLMDYTPRGGDVADPWYSERFDVAYRDIYEGCKALLDVVLKQDKQ